MVSIAREGKEERSYSCVLHINTATNIINFPLPSLFIDDRLLESELLRLELISSAGTFVDGNKKKVSSDANKVIEEERGK